MSFNTFSLMDSPVYNNSGFNTPTPSLRTTHLVESVSKTPSHPFMLYNPSTPVPPLNRSSKRRKENEPLVDLLPLNRDYVQVQVEPPSKKRKTTRDKLDAIFLALQKERLSFGEFIFLASRHKDKNNQPIQRSQTHAMSISSFLQGKTSHTPSMIVECWYQSADGRASVSGSISMFAMSPVYNRVVQWGQGHTQTEFGVLALFQRL